MAVYMTMILPFLKCFLSQRPRYDFWLSKYSGCLVFRGFYSRMKRLIIRFVLWTICIHAYTFNGKMALTIRIVVFQTVIVTVSDRLRSYLSPETPFGYQEDPNHSQKSCDHCS